MDKRYDKIMEHVEVTPEMRQRILKQIEQMDPAKNAPPKVIAISRIRRLRSWPPALPLYWSGR